jgi:DNA-binding NarL/FixJ family response regulator
MTVRQAEQLKVVLADDSVLFRSGLASLLQAAGIDVVAEAGDVPSALAAVERSAPSVAVLDVRMPPSHTDEGIRAALDIRRRFPTVGVMVLSTYAESSWVARLLAGGADGLGYMLKNRVDDVATLVAGLERVSTGGTSIDPHVITRLISTRERTGQLDKMTDRERDVLALMAEGLTNAGIAKRLFLASKTVEAHVASVFLTLGIYPDSNTNRRVRAVVTFLREGLKDSHPEA